MLSDDGASGSYEHMGAPESYELKSDYRLCQIYFGCIEWMLSPVWMWMCMPEIDNWVSVLYCFPPYFLRLGSFTKLGVYQFRLGCLASEPCGPQECFSPNLSSVGIADGSCVGAGIHTWVLKVVWWTL